MQKPVDRLKRKIDKENLWLFILSSLEGKKRYGKELRGLIEKKFDFITGKVTAYKILYLLESGGYVKSKKVGKRVYYEITSSGKRELQEGRKYLKKLSKTI